MIRKILILSSLVFLNGCTIIGFERGLNYQKSNGYNFKYDEDSHDVAVNKNRHILYVSFVSNSCGEYGLIGPLILPVIPFWQNYDCKDIVIGVVQATKVHIIYHDQIYNPSKVARGGTYFFPIPIKSISENAILVAEKDGEKFEIPFRYQHTFSFYLWPGR